MSYYNSTGLTGPELQAAIDACSRQELAVRRLYRQHGDMTPSECHRLYNCPDTPLTSIRRAITDLTAKRLLHKTAAYRVGPYGKREHVWSVNLSPAGPASAVPEGQDANAVKKGADTHQRVNAAPRNTYQPGKLFQLLLI